MPATESAADLRTFRDASVKTVDTWVEKLLVDRLAAFLAFGLLKLGLRQPSAPYVVTVLSFLLRAGTAGLFLTDHLVAGAIVFFAAMVSDSVDGNLSRAVFGKDPEARGTLDVALDWLGAGLLLLVLHFLFVDAEKKVEASLMQVTAVLLVLTEFAIATKFRLCAKKGLDPDAASLSPPAVGAQPASPLLRMMASVKSRFTRRGLIMIPSMVDGEFVLFVIAPLFAFDRWALIISVVIFAIVMIANYAIAFLLLTGNEGGKTPIP